MTSQPILLYYGTPTTSDLRLAKLSHVFGVICKLVNASALTTNLDKSSDHSLCVLVNANTMSRVSAGSSIMECLLRKARFLFVYGFTAEETHISLACFLADGLISNLYRFSHN